ncbi:MAG TPA: alpha/beta hydrolase [Parafilimonas sp.]|nr:alpha/beta hydrolase [Parafilimonas sp.]
MKTTVIILAFVVSLLFQACSTTEQKQTPPIVVKNGDVTIAYDKVGDGDTTILFVHGWAINRSFWQQQVDAFGKRYTVVAVDLGGHGESGHNRNTWNINDFANDVAAAIDTLRLKNIILVGHSMAGDIVVETALARPGDVIGIIGIDNLNDFTSSFSSEEQKQIDDFIGASKQNFTETVVAYTKGSLFPENYADTISVNRVINSIKQTDSTIAANTLAGVIAYATTEAQEVSKLKLPLHLIESNRTVVNKDTLAKYCKAGFYVKTINGTGHYPMIEKPAEFNTLLQETIDDIGKGK